MPLTAQSDKAPCIVILAGGRSARFGRDKAHVDVLGQTSLARVLAAAHEALGEVVTDAGEACVTVHDTPAGGPLGAILEVFASRPDRDLVVLACDLPFVDAATIRRLIAIADVPDIDALVPRVAGRAQPLAAAYRAAAAPKLRHAWDTGERAIVKALSQLRIGWIDDLAADALDDFDTPADLARLEARHRDHGA